MTRIFVRGSYELISLTQEWKMEFIVAKCKVMHTVITITR